MNAKLDEAISTDWLQKIYPIVRGLKQYHQHQVVGLENIPRKGPAILAFNHSLATYDISLLFLDVFDHYGRLVRPLADHLFFKIPFLGDLVEEIGGVDGRMDNARALLQQGELIGVAPGGMREALRPSSERYQILWHKRKGFARLALETGAPVLLCVCPKADDLYDVYQNPVTAWAYKHFKIPLFLAKGMAFTPFPRKIKLVHFVSEPLYPPKPKADPQALNRQVERFQQKVIKRCRELIGEAIAYREP